VFSNLDETAELLLGEEEALEHVDLAVEFDDEGDAVEEEEGQ
jgi:hypothetical protein